MAVLSSLAPNLVQSIRAFRINELQAEASDLGQHFLYAYCGDVHSKEAVLGRVATSFCFPSHFGQNFDALYDCLTDLVHKSGPQAGFVIVLEQLPHAPEFDREARETLLDVFRDASDYWAKKGVCFRVFYS